MNQYSDNEVELINLLDGFYTVETPHRFHNEKLEWCFFNCAGRFSDKTVGANTNRWYFEHEKDALLFVLKWS
jgi:hypothetical protein